jgi:hypothetical protein
MPSGSPMPLAAADAFAPEALAADALAAAAVSYTQQTLPTT